MNKRRGCGCGLTSLLLIVLLAVTLFFAFDSRLGLTQYTIASDKLPLGFDGFRILLLADIHGQLAGGNRDRLTGYIEEYTPDMIVLAGDLIDDLEFEKSGEINYDNMKELLPELIAAAPVFFVSGNHDRWTPLYEDFIGWLADSGVTVLETAKTTVSRGGDSITVAGIADPAVWSGNEADEYLSEAEELMGRPEGYSILLFHRGNMFDGVSKMGYDLVLSGHIHGGHARIPLIGGLLSPNREWFPKYDAGVYWQNGSTMVLSRGIGSSVPNIPRLFNPPEAVLVTLEREG